MDPEAMEAAVEARLGVAVAGSTALEGGEVGYVRAVSLADGRVVVAKAGPAPLDLEARQLRRLGRAGLPVPDVIAADPELLVLEHIAGDGRVDAAATDAARRLAALHGTTGRAFGYPEETRKGRLRQPNPWTDSWVAFYRDHRLRLLARQAREAGVLPDALSDRIDALADALGAWLPASPPPSLLHGDVWRENVIVRDGTVRAFLDPASYYGHAELELAYVAWTGAFGEPFFRAYRDRREIDDGFGERRRVYEVSFLLDHLLHFREPAYRRDLEGTLAALGY